MNSFDSGYLDDNLASCHMIRERNDIIPYMGQSKERQKCSPFQHYYNTYRNAWRGSFIGIGTGYRAIDLWGIHHWVAGISLDWIDGA